MLYLNMNYRFSHKFTYFVPTQFSHRWLINLLFVDSVSLSAIHCISFSVRNLNISRYRQKLSFLLEFGIFPIPLQFPGCTISWLYSFWLFSFMIVQFYISFHVFSLFFETVHFLSVDYTVLMFKFI